MLEAAFFRLFYVGLHHGQTGLPPKMFMKTIAS